MGSETRLIKTEMTLDQSSLMLEGWSMKENKTSNKRSQPEFWNKKNLWTLKSKFLRIKWIPLTTSSEEWDRFRRTQTYPYSGRFQDCMMKVTLLFNQFQRSTWKQTSLKSEKTSSLMKSAKWSIQRLPRAWRKETTLSTQAEASNPVPVAGAKWTERMTESSHRGSQRCLKWNQAVRVAQILIPS